MAVEKLVTPKGGSKRVTQVRELSKDVEEPTEDGNPVVLRGVDFDGFYSAEYHKVSNLAFVLLGDRSGAEDIAQEAFMAAYRRWPEIRHFDNPGAWVRRVVANRAVSVVRRRAVELRGLARLGGRSSVVPELSADALEVWQAVRRLPRRQAQVIALFYMDDLSLNQVSETLGLSRETVRTHMKRARKTLSLVLDTKEVGFDS